MPVVRDALQQWMSVDTEDYWGRATLLELSVWKTLPEQARLQSATHLHGVRRVVCAPQPSKTYGSSSRVAGRHPISPRRPHLPSAIS